MSVSIQNHFRSIRERQRKKENHEHIGYDYQQAYR